MSGRLSPSASASAEMVRMHFDEEEPTPITAQSNPTLLPTHTATDTNANVGAHTEQKEQTPPMSNVIEGANPKPLDQAVAVQQQQQLQQPPLQAVDAKPAPTSEEEEEEVARTSDVASADGNGTNNGATKWEIGSVESVASRLGTSLTHGLSASEAQTRLETNGPNELKRKAQPTVLRIFLANLTDALMILLLAAGIVSLALQEYPEGGAILATVVINAAIATYTEKSSGDALAALLKLTAATCRVRRSGSNQAAGALEEGAASKEVVIPARELVVGDVVFVDAGTVSPADIRLITCQDCRMDEAMLTGESLEVSKNHLWKPTGKGELSPGNMLFSGTNMTTGRAVGVVVATGMQTRIGRIAALLQDDKEDEDEEDVDSDDEDEDEPAVVSKQNGGGSAAALAAHGATEPVSSNKAPVSRALSRQASSSHEGESVADRKRRHEFKRQLTAKNPDPLATVPRGHSFALVGTEEDGKTKKTLPDKQEVQKKKPSKKNAGRTALQQQLRMLALGLSIIGIIGCILVFVVGIGRGYEDPSHADEEPWLVLLLTAVSLAVGAIPEGLPVAITVCLALGSLRLSKAKTIVRQLPAVENLGAVTVICTDKTGTLTQGKMTTTRVFSQGRLGLVSGKGYSPVGDVTFDGISIQQMPKNEVVGFYLTMLLGGCLCNNTQVVKDPETGKLVSKGNMSEAPLVVCAQKLALRQGPETDEFFPRVDEIPFNSKRKLMATLHANTLARKENGEKGPFPGAASVLTTPYFSTCKGAPNYVLARCSHTIGPKGELKPLTEADRKELLDTVDELSAQALRVLAMAYAPMDELPYQKAGGKAWPSTSGSARTLGESSEDVLAKLDHLATNLVFAGFAASIDPPRDGIKHAIDTAKTAGIRTIMITGDYVSATTNMILSYYRAHCMTSG